MSPSDGEDHSSEINFNVRTPDSGSMVVRRLRIQEATAAHASPNASADDTSTCDLRPAPGFNGSSTSPIQRGI
ncbi:hypothetical protein GCM10027610_025360 [Dactylosporangium cerinum]